MDYKVGDSFNEFKKWVRYNTPTYLMNGRQVIIKEHGHEIVISGNEVITKIVRINRISNPLRKWTRYKWKSYK